MGGFFLVDDRPDLPGVDAKLSYPGTLRTHSRGGDDATTTYR
ncbi:MAG: hypothetical protein AAFX44_05510 [Pseudomonadota bacterium]